MPSPGSPREAGWSVLLPTYQAAPYLRDCFDALWAQDFPGEVEVLVADGGSTDGTRELVEAEIARGRSVRLFANPGRLQAAGLNVALEHARHELVVRCDAQSRFPRDALSLLTAEHRRFPGANVGGRQVAVAPGTTVGDAVAAVYNTRIGSGGAGYRVGDEPRDVDTVYLGSWPRGELVETGGFSTAVGPNEDTELNVRWRRAGKRVRLLPELAIGYRPRATFAALARQYGRYGYWRTRTIALHGEIGPRQVAALAPLGAAGIAVAAGRRWPFARLPLAGYLAVLALAGVRTRQRAAVRAMVPPVLATMHLSWGAGFMAGLVTLAVRRGESGTRSDRNPSRLPPLQCR